MESSLSGLYRRKWDRSGMGGKTLDDVGASIQAPLGATACRHNLVKLDNPTLQGIAIPAYAESSFADHCPHSQSDCVSALKQTSWLILAQA